MDEKGGMDWAKETKIGSAREQPAVNNSRSLCEAALCLFRRYLEELVILFAPIPRSRQTS